MQHVIIGAGPAGVTACETLRKLDSGAQITLVGDEREVPYSRMAIPYYLTDKIGTAGTNLRADAGCYEQRRIDRADGDHFHTHPKARRFRTWSSISPH